ncbi:hypothetical protein KDJ56_11865 [Brevibacillus composti]|uniref:Uncharacterized protein n=1 Tax=Brevibacillus composti TaxID=2796470 RepID=A0A7T5JM29_9BACL|nr:hypothetical protein [Brevibacillus composti]QQE72674.1 hypothetical protein JD108_11920 [Brevibacillus composti]QUO39752.1 hypothetical protein KDJ56_11865 [Brevibacillus composti]
MKKKELKRLFKANPDFEAWLKQDPSRVASIRSNPAAAGDLFKRWSDRKKGKIDFENISQKTKRASEMLSNMQSIMDMMSDYSKKQAGL